MRCAKQISSEAREVRAPRPVDDRATNGSAITRTDASAERERERV
jgi:hypothetical protein